MRLRRASGFAAAWVLIGCAHPPPARHRAAPVIEPPSEVAVIEEPPAVAEEMPEPCSREWFERGYTCNPPPADRVPPEPPPVANPPAPIVAHVVALDTNGDDERTTITLDVGTADGIDKNWSGKLTKDGKVLAVVTLFKITTHASYGRVELPLWKVKRASDTIDLHGP